MSIRQISPLQKTVAHGKIILRLPTSPSVDENVTMIPLPQVTPKDISDLPPKSLKRLRDSFPHQMGQPDSQIEGSERNKKLKLVHSESIVAHPKALPSDENGRPQKRLLPVLDSTPIPQLIRTPSLSHQEIMSDNGKRKWIIIKHLGKGGCGDVFLAREWRQDIQDIDTPLNPFVALKIVKDKKQFVAELKTMKLLNDHPLGRGGTPKLICACKKSRALVMEYLANSLSHQFEKRRFRLSLKTCLMLAINMLQLSREFYTRTHQVHVDIKPSNFCTGQYGNELSLIDFGYSTSPSTRLPGQTGTPLFMAWTIQTIGNTYPTWQDDLESIGYVIMFFIAGGKKGLPWGHLKTHADIAQAKNDLSIREFCYRLKGTMYEPIADALEMYLFLTRNRIRPFREVEDFHFLIGLFQRVMYNLGLVNDQMYDWVKPTVGPMTPISATIFENH